MRQPWYIEAAAVKKNMRTRRLPNLSECIRGVSWLDNLFQTNLNYSCNLGLKSMANPWIGSMACKFPRVIWGKRFL